MRAARRCCSQIGRKYPQSRRVAEYMNLRWPREIAQRRRRLRKPADMQSIENNSFLDSYRNEVLESQSQIKFESAESAILELSEKGEFQGTTQGTISD